ncbi:MAG: folate-binding protein YgfZ [Hyphomicrobiaceae bacterium]
MTTAPIALLPDRGVVYVTGEDARHFLDNLVTNDMDLIDRQPAIHAGLLTPQGKILFAFFIVKAPEGFLLETSRAVVPDLVKRLTLYKLRAKVVLADISASRAVVASWGGALPEPRLGSSYPDARSAALGWRHVVAPETAAELAPSDAGAAAYDRLRIAAGVPEAGRDYALGDTFPHEANFDRQGGVSFTKGCFVGQEVVARMQHKTVVRKRVVRVSGSGPLTEGVDVTVGEAVIGRVGTAEGADALALLRLDRALEAREKGQALSADGVTLDVAPADLEAYSEARKARAATA